MEHASSLREKLLAIAVSVAMAFAMVSAVSVQSAWADDSTSDAGSVDISSLPTSVYFEVKSNYATVAAGQQLNFRAPDDNWIQNVRVEPKDAEYHFDFFVDQGAQYASVNKHSGVLTGIKEGKARVAVCLVAGPEKQPGSDQKPNTPDGTILMINYIYVDVTAPAEAYGFQGTTNALRMVDPEVSGWAGNLNDGYTNQLGMLKPADDGCYYFTYELTAGFNNYQQPVLYAAYNAGNIEVVDSSGFQVGALNASNSGALTVSSLNNSVRQVTLKFDPSKVDLPDLDGQYALKFYSGLKANNANRVLGTNVTFDFSVATDSTSI